MKPAIYKTINTLSVIVFTATVMIIVVPVFICDLFKIGGNSMNPTLMTGDQILVNKLILGARIYTNYDFTLPDVKSFRMPGIRKLRPGDVVVFNSPDGRDVNTINFKINYVYAKRCIGCPGDTIRIIGGFYHNSDFGGIIGQQYMQEKLSETPDSTLWMMGVSVDAGQFAGNNGWTVKNFGPLYVPEKGISIRLDPETALKFAKIIQYETGFWPEIQNNKVFINGIYRNEYCFQENYYFLGGDNVFNSRDSRYIGLIPEEYVIGVATTILFSKDSNGDFRHDRWFKAIFG